VRQQERSPGQEKGGWGTGSPAGEEKSNDHPARNPGGSIGFQVRGMGRNEAGEVEEGMQPDRGSGRI
jgi:hypothetical protein